MMETRSDGVFLLTDEPAEESASARRRRERGIFKQLLEKLPFKLVHGMIFNSM